ncbi:hypothetical protein CSAL01_13768, partial [Colletotrichum salicis]
PFRSRWDTSSLSTRNGHFLAVVSGTDIVSSSTLLAMLLPECDFMGYVYLHLDVLAAVVRSEAQPGQLAQVLKRVRHDEHSVIPTALAGCRKKPSNIIRALVHVALPEGRVGDFHTQRKSLTDATDEGLVVHANRRVYPLNGLDVVTVVAKVEGLLAVLFIEVSLD